MNEPRDAHLLAALRHAPDRDAAPPPELTARILAAARAAAQPAPSAPSAWQRWRAWFAQPQSAAAFATLAVAVLVGLIWSTQEPPLPASVSPEVAQEDKRQAAPMAAERVAPRAPTSVLKAPRAAAAPAAPAPAVPKAPGEQRSAKKEADRPGPARATAKPLNEASADAARPALPATPTPTPAPAPAPAPAPEPAPAPAVAPPPAPAAPAADSRADAAAAARSRSEAPPAHIGGLSRQAAAPSLQAADKAASFDPLVALEAAGSAGWSWSAPVGERAHGPAQRELLAAMRAATQGRWSAAPPTQAFAPWLQLRHSERGAALWLIGGALVFADADGRTWRASVTPDEAREWQQAVARW